VTDVRPRRFHVDRQEALALLRFGRWVLGSNVLMFAAAQGDNAVVGAWFGTYALGLYQVAFRVAEMPIAAVVQPAIQLMFPVLSNLQESLERLRKWYTVAALVLAGGVGAVCSVVWLIAPWLARTVLGPEWGPSVPVLRVLAISSLFRTVAIFGQPAFYAVGRPEIHFRVNAVRLAVMLGLAYPLGSALGLVGVGWAVAGATGAAALTCVAALRGVLRDPRSAEVAAPRFEV